MSSRLRLSLSSKASGVKAIHLAGSSVPNPHQPDKSSPLKSDLNPLGASPPIKDKLMPMNKINVAINDATRSNKFDNFI